MAKEDSVVYEASMKVSGTVDGAHTAPRWPPLPAFCELKLSVTTMSRFRRVCTRICWT
jgi:hypothetical protein